MRSDALTPEKYISEQPEERQEALKKLRSILLEHLPEGVSEEMSYGMIGYVVPHAAYPAGYHCDPKLPLPFVHLASQKNYLALYHMGLYMDESLMEWFSHEAIKAGLKKADFGKSCIRFKKLDVIPYDLIAGLCTRMSMDEFITLYEKVKRK